MGISGALDWNDKLRVGARELCISWLLLGPLWEGFSPILQKISPSGPDEWKCHGDPPASELSGAALDRP